MPEFMNGIYPTNTATIVREMFTIYTTEAINITRAIFETPAKKK